VATAVISAFVLGWISMAAFMGLFVTLSIRLNLRDKSEWPPSLKRWHSIYSWPYFMLKTDNWSSSLDRRMVRIAHASAAVSAASLALVAAAYLSGPG
jgi:hypothetical protein